MEFTEAEKIERPIRRVFEVLWAASDVAQDKKIEAIVAVGIARENVHQAIERYGDHHHEPGRGWSEQELADRQSTVEQAIVSSGDTLSRELSASKFSPALIDQAISKFREMMSKEYGLARGAA